MKCNVRSLYIAGSMFALSAAHAEKVLVKLHSPDTFHALEVRMHEALEGARGHRDVYGRAAVVAPRLFGSTARLTQLLGQLNMVVAEVSSPDDLAALRASSEVAFVEEDMMIPAPQIPLAVQPTRGRSTTRPTKEMPWGIVALKSAEAWAATPNGSAGEGAKVVILDTGIDKEHPDLAARFAAGKNFMAKTVADLGRTSDMLLTDGSDWTTSDTSYDYFDVVGHGTHVAGTIAGELDNHGVVGVAPKAKLYAGRVCGKLGCSSVAIVNGMNWAIEVGADVVNMSLGGPMKSKAQADAMTSAINAGVIPVAASGNGGNDSVSFPAAYPGVIAVGAISSDLHRAVFSQYGPELAIVAPGVDILSSVPMGSGRESEVKVYLSGSPEVVKSTSFVGAPEVPQEFSGTLVAAGIGNVEDFTAAVRGHVALISRGTIPFADKVKNAIDAGASAVVVYNNEEGLISGALTQDGSEVAIPVVMIEKAVGEALKSALPTSEQRVSFLTKRTDYAAFQGTSMASPHVAGLVALLKAANPRLTASQARSLLRATATPLQDSANNQTGAGLVNAQAAMLNMLSGSY